MAAGIIAEFNPFHNGHKYLVQETARKTGAPVVAVMSGSWVQRGDIAITDKYTRAKAALKNGVDLVIELPVTFSMNTAQKFAYGAVSILKATGIVDTLVFGAENDNAHHLRHAADLITNEPPEVSLKIKKLIANGMSYPAAREKAYSGIIDSSVLASPNNILAVEYIRAAVDIGFAADFMPVKRIGAAHDSADMNGSTASAGALREIIRGGGSISRFIPYDTPFDIYDPKKLDTAVIAVIRAFGVEYIQSINDVSEGLENRFVKAASAADTAAGLCSAVKSKRYTHSRIRRIAYSILLGLTKELCSLPPSYIRVLGMNDTGKTLLKQMKKTASLPVIIKAADYPGDPVFAASVRADDIFALCAPRPELRRSGRYITVPPVIL